jgi:hypothetical protein
MGFRERMAQLKQRATDFGSDAVSKWKQAGERSNQQYFGTSPLQQAMHQQRQGNMTPEAMEMMRDVPSSERMRQAEMMEMGRHGGYGQGGVNTRHLPYAPSNVGHTQSIERPADGAQGPPQFVAKTQDAGGGVETSTQVQDNDVKGLADRTVLNKLMSTDPSKMNVDGRKMMQQLMNNLGYTDDKGNKLDIDGRVGPLTAQAMGNYNKSIGIGGPEGALPEQKMISGPDGMLAPQTRYANTPSQHSSWDAPNATFGPKTRHSGYYDQQHNSGISNPENNDNPLGADTYGEEAGLYGPSYVASFLGKEKFK